MYSKKKKVKLVPAPESYVADMIDYRVRKKVIKENIFVEDKPPKKLNNKKKNLTEAQEKRLKKHSEHHTKKHINEMRKDLLNGISFKISHERAQKKVGK